MRAHSDNRPKLVEKLGISLYSYNHDINEVADGGYDYLPILFDHIPKREEVINSIVTAMYPHNEELALQRKGIINPQEEEFVAYYSRVETIKQKVSQEYDNYDNEMV
jgi:hypothetical protein